MTSASSRIFLVTCGAFAHHSAVACARTTLEVMEWLADATPAGLRDALVKTLVVREVGVAHEDTARGWLIGPRWRAATPAEIAHEKAQNESACRARKTQA